MQLRERGCDVLAVEPDPGMAAVAAGKGLHVETAKFEQWDPSGREFDIVAFGQSFHWVDPVPALSRIRKILTPSGTLALAWTRIAPQGPPARRIDETLDEYLPQQDRSSGEVDSEGAEQDGPAPLVEVLRRNSFDVEELHFEESLRYAPEAWLSMVATHSDQLTMGTEDRLALHTALRDALGQDVIGLSFALDPPPEQPTAPTAASTTRTTAPAAQLPAPRHPQFEKTPTTRLMAVARMTALKT